MLFRITQTIRSAVRGQLWIANKLQDRSSKRFSVAGFNEQTIFPMLNNFRNIAHLCGDDGASAGKGFAQHNRRGFSAQRSDHNHITRRINVGRVPAIPCHDDLVGPASLVYGVPYVDPALWNASGLTDDNEARIRSV